MRSNATLESDAGVHFLRMLHVSFPTVAINTDTLLQQQGKNTRLRRVFKPHSKRYRVAFLESRKQFVLHTLDTGTKIPVMKSLGDARLYFDGTRPDGKPNDYVKGTYEEIEIDCLAKVCLPPGFEWMTDSAQSSSFDVSFLAENKHDQQVPVHSSQEAASTRRASITSSMSATASVLSTQSDKHYPDGASHYIVGEAYHTMGSTVPFQKLLQLERVLRFLLVKEKQSDVLQCIAGAVFLGSFDESARSRMAKVLKHYSDALPLLFKLQQNRRFLAINMQQHSTTAVDHLRMERQLLRQQDAMQAQLEAQSTQLEALKQQMAEMSMARGWLWRLFG